jgi:hypothetical protein
MIWERTRHVLRLRSTLREYFPAALDTFVDLDEPDALELLAAAPDPDRPARLNKAKITGALKRARCRNVADRAVEIQQSLRKEALRQPGAVQTAFAAITLSEVRLITALNREIDTLGEVVGEHFGRHPDAEIYASQPGLGVILGARVLAEFGDDPHRFADGKARKNYSSTSPITKASGTKKQVMARYARNTPPGRCAAAMGDVLAARITRRPRLLRPTASPEDQPSGRATARGQPQHRHPARLPENPHPLRREHRLGTRQHRSRLTNKILGCLPLTGLVCVYAPRRSFRRPEHSVSAVAVVY